MDASFAKHTEKSSKGWKFDYRHQKPTERTRGMLHLAFTITKFLVLLAMFGEYDRRQFFSTRALPREGPRIVTSIPLRLPLLNREEHDRILMFPYWTPRARHANKKS